MKIYSLDSNLHELAKSDALRILGGYLFFLYEDDSPAGGFVARAIPVGRPPRKKGEVSTKVLVRLEVPGDPESPKYLSIPQRLPLIMVVCTYASGEPRRFPTLEEIEYAPILNDFRHLIKIATDNGEQ